MQHNVADSKISIFETNGTIYGVLMVQNHSSLLTILCDEILTGSMKLKYLEYHLLM